MNKIGDIRKGREVGHPSQSTVIWHACVDCGKERWTRFFLKRNEPENKRCNLCSSHRRGGTYKRGEMHANWKGGRKKDDRGYIKVMLFPDDFFYPMVSKGGYVFEHRLVVAKALGRCLHIWEIVHHKHTKYPKGSIEDKQDNRYPENLQLVSDDRHTQITILENRINHLENEVNELKKVCRLQSWQIKELGKRGFASDLIRTPLEGEGEE